MVMERVNDLSADIYNENTEKKLYYTLYNNVLITINVLVAIPKLHPLSLLLFYYKAFF